MSATTIKLSRTIYMWILGINRWPFPDRRIRGKEISVVLYDFLVYMNLSSHTSVLVCWLETTSIETISTCPNDTHKYCLVSFLLTMHCIFDRKALSIYTHNVQWSVTCIWTFCFHSHHAKSQTSCLDQLKSNHFRAEHHRFEHYFEPNGSFFLH